MEPQHNTPANTFAVLLSLKEQMGRQQGAHEAMVVRDAERDHEARQLRGMVAKNTASIAENRAGIAANRDLIKAREQSWGERLSYVVSSWPRLARGAVGLVAVALSLALIALVIDYVAPGALPALIRKIGG